MRILLDTNVVIWMLGVSDRLSSVTRAVLNDPGNELLISVATVHEIAIKVSIGKLRVPAGFLDHLAAKGCAFLAPSTEDAWRVAELPLIHRDPFDRLIVSQAIGQGLTLMTGDHGLAEYGVPILLV